MVGLCVQGDLIGRTDDERRPQLASRVTSDVAWRRPDCHARASIVDDCTR